MGQLSSRSIFLWRIAQSLVWLLGLAIVFILIFNPILGIHLFWNILIPVAPLLLVVAVGVWRNVCPMASTALLPRHLKLSQKKKLTLEQTGKLNLIAVIALFVIVPLRHAIFDKSGLATALLIVSLGIVSLVVGSLYEWKSAWCSGLCPVHPVEKLYGLKNKLTIPNAHCDQCQRCVTPCPDSVVGIHPLSTTKTKYHNIAGVLLVGAFPGFIWGWFQVPDYPGISSLGGLITIYKMPMLGVFVTIVAFLILKRIFQEKIIISIFAAMAVSCYYWFRIPALIGYGVYPGDGMLVDLSSVIPEWSLTPFTIAMTLFFFLLIVFSKQKKTSWVTRPAFAAREEVEKKIFNH